MWQWEIINIRCVLTQKPSHLLLLQSFFLIFIGGYVSASGVGLTCPDWPLCPQGLVPHEDFIIEYIHRSVATTGMLVIATMAFTLKSKDAPRGMKIAFYNELWHSDRTDNSGGNSDSWTASRNIGDCPPWARAGAILNGIYDFALRT